MIMALEKQTKQPNSFDYYVSTEEVAVASRSVPGSRRNSNDEKRSNSLFDTSFNHYDTPIDFLMKPPPRSFSIDVGSMNNQNYTSSLFFDDNDNTDAATTSFHQNNYLRSRYNNNNTNNSNILNNNASYGLFASSAASDLELETSLRKNSARSVESLRSKSWAQFLDNTSLAPQQQQQQYYQSSPGPLDSVATTQDVQAAFYGQPARRFSQGWVPTSVPSNSYSTTTSAPPPSSSSKNRLATSYSNSDLPMVAALGSYRMNNAVSTEACQHLRQYGHCTLKEQCPYSHIMQSNENMPALRYSNSTSTCNSNTMVEPSPFYDSPLFNKELSRKNSTTTVLVDSEMNKFAGLQLEEFQGKLYELCKDQHGCRFLQMKLEESASNVAMIYQEIHAHFVDLMTDPFGNYLCQKLLERCDDTQRSSIVEVIAPEFLKICLSMHGTRAVQKLIEFLSTKRQIQAVIVALEPNVVALIKDLNGNHVIQKCLHKLSPEHNQFIYDTVSQHCIEVASHKHGCCVYQRCIDHAVQSQKTQLVNVITQNALPLVQDPFGNYVVQYVLELGDAKYSDDLIRRFIDPVRELSVQKFSSNVIEKCIRVAERDTRRLLIAGIINHPNMERFLRDSYANYVIQTCLDSAEEDQRMQFIECIRPLLPSIRNTPYGKRIYSKIHNTSTRPMRQQRMMNNNILNGMNALSFNNNSSTTSNRTNNSNETSVFI